MMRMISVGRVETGELEYSKAAFQRSNRESRVSSFILSLATATMLSSRSSKAGGIVCSFVISEGVISTED